MPGYFRSLPKNSRVVCYLISKWCVDLVARNPGSHSLKTHWIKLGPALGQHNLLPRIENKYKRSMRFLEPICYCSGKESLYKPFSLSQLYPCWYRMCNLMKKVFLNAKPFQFLNSRVEVLEMVFKQSHKTQPQYHSANRPTFSESLLGKRHWGSHWLVVTQASLFSGVESSFHCFGLAWDMSALLHVNTLLWTQKGTAVPLKHIPLNLTGPQEGGFSEHTHKICFILGLLIVLSQ